MEKTTDAIERVAKAIEAFNESVAKAREELENMLRAELIAYIIARFNEVSYAKQPLHLKSKTREHPWKDNDGNVVLFGTDNPCKHWDVMGIKKTENSKEEYERTGQFYSGEIRYYVERNRKYRPSDDFKKSVFRIDKDCQLGCDELMEIAMCLKGYHRNVHMDSNWNGWYYDRD